MIIPIRCMTCGKPIGQLWDAYQKELKKGRSAQKVLDELGVDRYCCRSLFLTHRDLIKQTGQFKK